MIPGLSHLLLQVRDLAAAEHFYVDFLGFAVVDRGHLRDGRPLIVLREGLGLTIFPSPGEAGLKTVDHIAFRVEALEPLINKIVSAARPYEGPVQTARYGTSIYLTDPEGNRIELHDR